MIKVTIDRRGRDDKENLKLLNIALRKFRNKTKDLCKDYNRGQYFEKPCVENERIHRRRIKKKREIKLLKKRYGKNWEKHFNH